MKDQNSIQHVYRSQGMHQHVGTELSRYIPVLTPLDCSGLQPTIATKWVSQTLACFQALVCFNEPAV